MIHFFIFNKYNILTYFHNISPRNNNFLIFSKKAKNFTIFRNNNRFYLSSSYT